MKNINDLANFIENKANSIDKIVAKCEQLVAKKILQDIKQNAPIGNTGEYINSIKIYPTKIENNVISTFIGSELMVGPAKINGISYNLGYLLEHGTSPHDIFPYDAQSLKFMIDGKEIFAKHVWHPGTTSQPHYRLALEKNKKFFKDNIKVAWREK